VHCNRLNSALSQSFAEYNVCGLARSIRNPDVVVSLLPVGVIEVAREHTMTGTARINDSGLRIDGESKLG